MRKIIVKKKRVKYILMHGVFVKIACLFDFCWLLCYICVAVCSVDCLVVISLHMNFITSLSSFLFSLLIIQSPLGCIIATIMKFFLHSLDSKV